MQSWKSSLQLSSSLQSLMHAALAVTTQLLLQWTSREVHAVAMEVALALRHSVETSRQALSHMASTLVLCCREGEDGHAEVHRVALALQLAPQSYRPPHPLC